MRAASRIRNAIGSIALLAALLLWSPGVRVSHAEADFSWDPALEAAPPAAPAPGDSAAGGTCPVAQPPAVMGPLRGLPVMPLPEDEQELHSLNGRGYNIGGSEPTFEMQRLMFEVKRRTQGR